jgi:subtilisin family serine protease
MSLVNTVAALGRHLFHLARALLLAVSIIGVASAQSAVDQKIAPDLREAINAAPNKNINWIKKIKGTWQVKVLVVSANSSDPELMVLRQAISGMGGSVIYRYISVPAVSVVVPLQSVRALAARADVDTISPNRMTARTDSYIEKVTGALSARGAQPQRAVDGRGIGIAVLDSGIMRNHVNMLDSNGNTRVVQSLNFLDAEEAQGSIGKKGWGEPGVDYAAELYPGSKKLESYLKHLQRGKTKDLDDPYGHGTHVASLAAGTARATDPDTTGIAPMANLFDLRVLDDEGVGETSDVLAAIDWMLYHQRELNIRVANLSLASDSTESYLTDPLCRAVRAAVAAGITVVVAAGNYGHNVNMQEVYGSISAPGNEPSVITVGSANSRETVARADDIINFFSSRGPTRGGYRSASNVYVPDNILKPELVAPGNKIVSSASIAGKLSNRLLSDNPGNGRRNLRGSTKEVNTELMVLSGTSVAAPQVAGAAAMLLQANPSLTPPMIKAILQYTAQALPNANLMQQGSGMLNVEGAVRLASALRQDVTSAVTSGTLTVGGALLAAGKAMPTPITTINGESFNWSQLAFAGGSSILTGDALFTKYQGFYDARLLWVRERVASYTPMYWAQPIAANGLPLRIKGVAAATNTSASLVSAGVRVVDRVAGLSNPLTATGLFTPTLNLANGVSQGTGMTLSEALRSLSGFIQSNGAVIGGGLTLSEGVTMGGGMTLSEGLTLSETIKLNENGSLGYSTQGQNVAQGEP